MSAEVESTAMIDDQKVVPVVSPIAVPMANEKLATRALKLVRKASKARYARRGVKEVHRAIRKKEKGIMILAGNISPIDVIAHIPIVCEENGIPYIFVPAKEELGAASATKRPTSVVLVLPHPNNEEYMEAYDKVLSAVKKAQINYN